MEVKYIIREKFFEFERGEISPEEFAIVLGWDFSSHDGAQGISPTDKGRGFDGSTTYQSFYVPPQKAVLQYEVPLYSIIAWCYQRIMQLHFEAEERSRKAYISGEKDWRKGWDTSIECYDLPSFHFPSSPIASWNHNRFSRELWGRDKEEK